MLLKDEGFGSNGLREHARRDPTWPPWKVWNLHLQKELIWFLTFLDRLIINFFHFKKELIWESIKFNKSYCKRFNKTEYLERFFLAFECFKELLWWPLAWLDDRPRWAGLAKLPVLLFLGWMFPSHEEGSRNDGWHFVCFFFWEENRTYIHFLKNSAKKTHVVGGNV